MIINIKEDLSNSSKSSTTASAFSNFKLTCSVCEIFRNERKDLIKSNKYKEMSIDGLNKILIDNIDDSLKLILEALP